MTLGSDGGGGQARGGPEGRSDRRCARRTVTIVNERGLHARASAMFVREASRFSSTIVVQKDDQVVGATSIMGLLMLVASCGSTLVVSATGPDAEEAVAALADLVGRGFGET